MNKKFFLTLLCILNVFALNSLDLNFNLISNNVFEVVIPKIENENIIYEKELPFEKLPYQFRNDKYFSVGSAFRIDKNRFLSAAHVFTAENDTFFTDIRIRDRSGTTYKIDYVYKYSNNKDFIMFSVVEDEIFVSNLENEEYLELSDEFEPATKVYTVGNAFGEGIVIRDGLLTSKTPEAKKGLWDWYRFSAAASPGNSGGPLINNKNKVIGIVTMKSTNENLNYALPVSEILNFKENYAEINLDLIYKLQILGDYSKSIKFDFTSELPLKYSEFKNKILKDFIKMADNAIIDINMELKDKLFPYGKGSLHGIYNLYDAGFPLIFATANENSQWNPYRPSVRPEKLENGITVQNGEIAGLVMAKLTTDDLTQLKKLWDNPNFVIDAIFEANNYTRSMGGENIKILSLGEYDEIDYFKDRFGREWQIATWNINYSDQKLIAIFHKTPDGIFLMYQSDVKANIEVGLKQDYKFIADYFYIGYKGSLAQWMEFLKLPSTAKLIKQTKISLNDNKVNVSNGDFILEDNSKNFNWDENSILEITPGIILEKNIPKLIIRNINIEDKIKDGFYFSITKYLPIVEDTPQHYIDAYNEVTNYENYYKDELNVTEHQKFRNTWFYKNENLFTIYCSFPYDLEDDVANNIALAITAHMNKEKNVINILDKGKKDVLENIEPRQIVPLRPWAKLNLR